MPQQHMARSAAAERARHTHAAVARVCRAELPEGPVLRQEFFVRLLPDFDAAWEEAARTQDLDDAALASLRELRTSVERAAERCLFPGREPRRHLRFCAHAVLIEMDGLVPESQVDCALAWAAEAMRGSIVMSARAAEADGDAARYRLLVQPWPALLFCTARCRGARRRGGGLADGRRRPRPSARWRAGRR